MSPQKVIIVFADGSYSVREYLSAEIARHHAGVACKAYPTAAVRVGDRLLREGSLDDFEVWAARGTNRPGAPLRRRLRVTA